MSAATFAAAQLLRVLPRTRITRAVGRLCEAKLSPALSTAVVSVYAKAYNVALDEAIAPDGAYDSFDAFFTRRLREGARSMPEDENVFISPADGKIADIGAVDHAGSLKIKGRDYSVADLTGDPGEAKRYAGGQFAVVYLSPRDYHRVHAPMGGQVTLIRSLPGELFPVNAIGERHIPSLFATNRRVAVVIDTPSKGRVTVVLVGAIIVGRITVSVIDARDVPLGMHVIDPGKPVLRGDEIGIFHLGSTAVVFAEKDASPPWTRAAGPIRFGEPLCISHEGKEAR